MFHSERPVSALALSSGKAGTPAGHLFSVWRRFLLRAGALWPEFCCSRLLCGVSRGAGGDATRSPVV